MTQTIPPDIPSEIDRYRTQRVIGRGGFATVVLARDEKLDADVALKVLDHHSATTPLLRDRFVDEARLLRRVRSSAVVEVFDIGELPDGRPYFVMEYAAGGCLADRMPSGAGRVGPDDLTVIVRAIAEGLSALHRHDVVHRDVKPDNVLILDDGHPDNGRGARPGATEVRVGLFGPGERLALSDLGIAKDHQRTSAGETIVGGTPRFRAPEQLSAGGEVGPAADIFAATALLWNVVAGEPPPEGTELDGALVGVDPRWQRVFGRGLDRDPAHRPATIDAWAADVLTVLDSPGADFRPARPGAVCPYKGLAAFQRADAEFYFGRGHLIDELVARLHSGPTLVIGGPSGSGKSSLLRAGLLPAIADGALPGSQGWDIALFTPGADPLGELRRQLLNLAEDDDDSSVPTVDELRTDPAAVVRCARPDRLFAIDQFEEIFTLGDDAAAFLAVIAELVGPRADRSRVAIAMRADFYGRAAAHPWLAAAINRSQLLVEPMGRSDLRAAIEGPASRAGLRFDPGVVDQMVDDTGADGGALPLLAHALMETWLRREDDRITANAYRAAGGVGGAIAQSADHTFEALDPDDQERARRLLLRLINPGDGTADTRRRLPWSEIDDDPATRAIVDRLVEARLVTADEQEVTVAHEALISSWPLLHRWIEESRDDLRMRQRIGRAATEWRTLDHDPGLLARDTPLATMTEWADGRDADLNRLEHDFLRASVDASDAQQAALAEAERRGKRRRRIAIGALALLAGAAVLASIVALSALGRSRDAELATERQLSIARSVQAGDLASSDPLQAISLAAESAMVSPDSPEPRRALITARQALATASIVPIGDPVPVGNPRSLTVSPDGRWVVLGHRDGTITVIDAATREPVDTLSGHARGIEEVVFSPDSSQLASASGGDEGEVFVWQIDDDGAAQGRLLARLDSAVWSVAYAPDGRTLAAATEDGQVLRFDSESGDPVGESLSSQNVDYVSATFSPDGSLIAAGAGTGEVTIWDVATAAVVVGPFAAHGSDVWEVLFHPDGRSMVTVSSDDNARVWDLSDIDAGTAPTPASDPFGGRALLGEGSAIIGDGQLVSGSSDGALWTAALGSPAEAVATAARHADEIIDLSSTADGSLLVSLSDDQTVQFWTATASVPIDEVVVALNSPGFGLAISPAGTKLAAGDESGRVHVTNLADGSTRVLDGHDGRVRAIAFAGETHLLTGDQAGTLRRWDLQTLALTDEAVGAHGAGVETVAVSPDGSTAVSGAADGSVALWPVDDLAARTAAERRPSGVTDALFLDADLIALTMAAQGEVTFINSAGEGSREPIQLADATAWGLSSSPDGQLLAVAQSDENVALYRLDEPNAAPVVLSGHRDGATHAVFLDDRTVMSASRAGQVVFWDIAGDRLTAPIAIGDTDRADAERDVWRLVSDPVGASAYTVSEDGTVRRLDVLDTTTACSITAPVRDFLASMNGDSAADGDRCDAN